MKTKTVMKSAGACALACASLGVAASAASAAGAAHLSPAGLAWDLGPVPIAQKGVTLGGSCPASYAADDMQLVFASGSAVLYRDGNGGNIEGQAMLYDNTTGMSTGYAGHAHVWFGQNINPNNTGSGGNQQQWFAETFSFDGSASDGTKVSISASFGGGTSASGNQSGWTHVKVSCS